MTTSNQEMLAHLKSFWNHILTSYFGQQLLMMLWDLSKSSPMEDWGGEEGLQNNFAKRWNRELGLFSMLGNKVVNSCLGGRSLDQRGDLARNWQTVQRHCKAGWVDRCEKEKGIICQIFALASKLGRILNFGDVFCPFSVKWKTRLKHVS